MIRIYDNDELKLEVDGVAGLGYMNEGFKEQDADSVTFCFGSFKPTEIVYMFPAFHTLIFTMLENQVGTEMLLLLCINLNQVL